MHAVQRRDLTAVVVPGRARCITGRIGIPEDMERIVDLRGDIVEIVVMVEEEDLRRKAGRCKGRTHGILEEIALLLPGHVERHRIAGIERLVLQRHSIDRIPAALHLLDPFHEVGGIVLVAGGIQAAVGPAVEGDLSPVAHLHPARTAPRRGNDLHSGIDGEYLVEDREQILLVQRMDGKVLDAGAVAPGKFVE